MCILYLFAGGIAMGLRDIFILFFKTRKYGEHSL